MEITPSLIQKYLDNKCTAAEAEMIALYLEKHPELMTVYLKSSWDAAGEEKHVPPGYEDEMRKAITAQIRKHPRVIRSHWLFAAASLLIVAGAIWLFSPATKISLQTLAKAEQQTAAPARWKTTTNIYAKAYTIKLADGSVLKLAPDAVIKYQEPFGQQNQRNIYMQGEADFDVAHDAGRPFTVHTKLFSTTALGTSFRVSETAVTCNVKLFTGKVVVQPLVAGLKGWIKNIVLLPGNEMRYSLKQGAVSVVQFNALSKQHSQARNTEHSNINEKALVFNNTPLPEVMKQLTARYHSPIFYKEELLKGKYFTGDVRQKDSLSVLLNVIANMNGLRVTKKEDSYIVTASK